MTSPAGAPAAERRPPGTLFVVATPIGNLEDLTFRALRVLREVDLIAAEDTRRTAKLLARYEIRKPLISVHEHNEFREAGRLIARLVAGESAALVSDAGTPVIADPGARVVREAREAGLAVVPIPGPSAVATALSVSGIAADEFVFMGFPPSTGRARDRWLQRLAAGTRTTVFFEAPHRIQRTLEQLAGLLGGREMHVFRELTKINESYVRWPNSAPVKTVHKGEFTVVIAPVVVAEPMKHLDKDNIFTLFCRLTNDGCFSDDDATRIVAIEAGADARDVAKIIKKAKISVKQQNKPPA
jgi:16S rRNA (cytidine1402-2'-O)-methyltransferase